MPDNDQTTLAANQPLTGREQYRQTSLKQYPTRAFRGEHLERQMQQQHAGYDRALEYQRLACTVPCEPGSQQLQGTERAGQIRARGELYDDIDPLQAGGQLPALAPQQRPLSVPPSRWETDQMRTRLPAVQMREERQQDAAERRTQVDERRAETGMEPTRNAARLAGNFSLSATHAERQKYACSYKEGNEAAYAHVEALQRAVRGYDDTSAQTMEQVKAWNAREGRNRSFDRGGQFSAF